MLWAALAIISALVIAIRSLTEKYLLKQRITSPSFAIFVGLMDLLYTAVVLPFADISAGFSIYGLGALGAGVLTFIYFILYLKSLSEEEVSRISPIFSAAPVFVAVFAAVWLGEIFSVFTYIAILLVVLGVASLSFRLELGFPKKIKNLEFILLAIVFIALAKTLAKWVLLNLDFKVYVAYHLFGFFLASCSLWLSKDIRKNFVLFVREFKLEFRLAFSAEMLALVDFILITYAIMLGPVSLVMTLSSLAPFFVLIFTLVLTIKMPHIIEEEFDKKSLILKIVGVFCVLAGVYLIL